MGAVITVVGLGSGDPDRLTLGSLKLLQEAQERYVRTKDHPVVAWLEETGVSFTSFDEVYEAKDDFPSVYEEIVERLIAAAKTAPEGKEVLYAVPGHPMVAEATVKRLQERCPVEGIELKITGEKASSMRHLSLSDSIRSKAFNCWMLPSCREDGLIPGAIR